MTGRQTDRPTDRLTTRLLELLRVAKKSSSFTILTILVLTGKQTDNIVSDTEWMEILIELLNNFPLTGSSEQP